MPNSVPGPPFPESPSVGLWDCATPEASGTKNCLSLRNWEWVSVRSQCRGLEWSSTGNCLSSWESPVDPGARASLAFQAKCSRASLKSGLANVKTGAPDASRRFPPADTGAREHGRRGAGLCPPPEGGRGACKDGTHCRRGEKGDQMGPRKRWQPQL